MNQEMGLVTVTYPRGNRFLFRQLLSTKARAVTIVVPVGCVNLLLTSIQLRRWTSRYNSEVRTAVTVAPGDPSEGSIGV